jgi:hypothetical protein
MAQVVSRRSLIAEARIRPCIVPCEYCGGQSVTGTGFSPSSSGFPCQYHSTGSTDSYTTVGLKTRPAGGSSSETYSHDNNNGLQRLTCVLASVCVKTIFDLKFSGRPNAMTSFRAIGRRQQGIKFQCCGYCLCHCRPFLITRECFAVNISFQRDFVEIICIIYFS